MTFEGFVSSVDAFPGTPRSGAFVVCGFAQLRLAATEERNQSTTHSYQLESSGPMPSLSRAFFENHPKRRGGFVADNVLFPQVTSKSLMSREGLLFKSNERYFEYDAPNSGDGPAPGPGKVGGSEINVFLSDVFPDVYVLQRYDAASDTYDLHKFGTLSLSVSSALGNRTSCPLPLMQKHLFDVSFRRGTEVVAAGSVGVVSGIPNLGEASALIVCGTVEIADQFRHGGPKDYTLVSLGPLQAYSPLYYMTGNGFFFFNNLIYSSEPVVDGSGVIFSANGESVDLGWELNLYYQNDKGTMVCNTTGCFPEDVGKEKYVVWLYSQKTDTLFPRVEGSLTVSNRLSCSVSKPLRLFEEPLAEGVATTFVVEKRTVDGSAVDGRLEEVDEAERVPLETNLDGKDSSDFGLFGRAFVTTGLGILAGTAFVMLSICCNKQKASQIK